MVFKTKYCTSRIEGVRKFIIVSLRKRFLRFLIREHFFKNQFETTKNRILKASQFLTKYFIMERIYDKI